MTDSNEPVPSLVDLSEKADARAVGILLQTTITPGVEVDVSPEDAELAGAFEEDALSLEEAKATAIDADQEG